MAGRASTVAVVAVLAAVLIGGLWYVGVRNGLVAGEEAVDGAWSEIDNQLQRRSDLIPNLVATVKGFAKQELAVFSEIAEARARMAGAGSVAEKAAAYNEMQSALGRLLVVVENYPDLKSNRNFLGLQDELAGTENRIAVARKRYNDQVRSFNTRIRQFPASAVAGGMGMERRDYFEIDEAARVAPTVTF